MDLILVEDSHSDAVLFIDSLEAHGHSVQRFQNGTQFCAALGDTLPSDLSEYILLLDLVMPEKDGFEVIRDLGQRKIKVPTILVSGHEGEYINIFKTLAEAYEIPVLAHLRKPVRISNLIKAIDDYVESAATTS